MLSLVKTAEDFKGEEKSALTWSGKHSLPQTNLTSLATAVMSRHNHNDHRRQSSQFSGIIRAEKLVVVMVVMRRNHSLLTPQDSVDSCGVFVCIFHCHHRLCGEWREWKKGGMRMTLVGMMVMVMMMIKLQ